METPLERQARLHRNYHEKEMTGKEIAQRERISVTRVYQIIGKEERRLAKQDAAPEYAKEYHSLPARVRNAIEAEGFDLDAFGVPKFGKITYSDADWLRVPNFGRKSLNQLKEYLSLWDFEAEVKKDSRSEFEGLVAAHLADAFDVALKLFPPLKEETPTQWTRRLRAMKDDDA